MFSPLTPVVRFLWIIHVANALNAAIPYEAVYFYNAYKIEYAASLKSGGPRTIATRCEHSTQQEPKTTPLGMVLANFEKSAADAGVAGICSFDEFLKSGVLDDGWKNFEPPTPTEKNPTSITITLDPDADAIATEALNPSKLGNRRLGFVAENLLSSAVLETYGKPNGRGKIAYPYPGTISKVSNAVQSARAVVAGDGTVIVQDAFKNVRVATCLLISIRMCSMNMKSVRIGSN